MALTAYITPFIHPPSKLVACCLKKTQLQVTCSNNAQKNVVTFVNPEQHYSVCVREKCEERKPVTVRLE